MVDMCFVCVTVCVDIYFVVDMCFVCVTVCGHIFCG